MWKSKKKRDTFVLCKYLPLKLVVDIFLLRPLNLMDLTELKVKPVFWYCVFDFLKIGRVDVKGSVYFKCTDDDKISWDFFFIR